MPKLENGKALIVNFWARILDIILSYLKSALKSQNLARNLKCQNLVAKNALFGYF